MEGLAAGPKKPRVGPLSWSFPISSAITPPPPPEAGRKAQAAGRPQTRGSHPHPIPHEPHRTMCLDLELWDQERANEREVCAIFGFPSCPWTQQFFPLPFKHQYGKIHFKVRKALLRRAVLHCGHLASLAPGQQTLVDFFSRTSKCPRV